MKKLTVFIISLLLFFSAVSQLHAQNSGSKTDKKVITVSRTEIINSDFVASSEKVEISGTVNGDAYIMAGQITVDGTINGDLIVLGGSVDVSGKILQNLRAAAGQITVNGEVGRNASIVSGNIDLTSKGKINGNAVLAGGNVNIQADIYGNTKIAAGDLTLGSRIGGNLETSVSNLRIISGGHIAGDLNYYSQQQAYIDQGAVISGKVNKHNPVVWMEPPAVPGGKALTGIIHQSKIFSLLFTFIFGVILIRFFPKFSSRTVETINSRGLASFGRGLIILLIIPVIIFMFTITIIGIPLAALFLILFIFILFIARIITIFWIGVYISGILGKRQQDIMAFVVGLLAYAILKFIPYISGLSTLLVTILGLGAWYLVLRNKNVINYKTKRRIASKK